MINNHEAKHRQLDKLLVQYGTTAERPAGTDGLVYRDSTQGGLEFAFNAGVGTAGTWLSTQEYAVPIAPVVLTASGQMSIPAPVGTWYISRLDLNVTQANAGSGTNFWSWALAQFGGITAGTVDTKLHSAGVGVIYSYIAFGTTAQNPAALANARATLVFTQNNVGAGNLTVFGAATLRKVG